MTEAIWNPWHGCHKLTAGCDHCYMYELDKARGAGDPSIVRKTNQFALPLQKSRGPKGTGYKVASGSEVRVCMTSDFFIAEADEWRKEAWKFIRQRPDVLFHLLTKRPERIKKVLPSGWGDRGWPNVMLSISVEDQEMADRRIPILLRLPFWYKGINAAPLLTRLNILNHLETNQIDAVYAAGENYDGARVCKYDWLVSLHNQCVKTNTMFKVYGTGSRFIREGLEYSIPHSKQHEAALGCGLDFKGRPIEFHLELPVEYTQLRMEGI